MNNKHASMRIPETVKANEAFPVVCEFPTDEDMDRMIKWSRIPTIFTHHAKHTADWLKSQKND